jgi:hypothetical protein
VETKWSECERWKAMKLFDSRAAFWDVWEQPYFMPLEEICTHDKQA